MATWKDGAAYAPIERPYGFASPEAQPLPQAAPRTAVTTPAVPPPSGYAPMPPQPELREISAATAPRRNPGTPFQVTGGLLTAGTPARGSRNPWQPFAVAPSIEPTQQLPPPNSWDRLPDQPTESVEPLTQPQRQLMFISGAAFLLALLVPAAAPVLFAVGGGLLLRTGPLGRRIALGALAVACLSGLGVLLGAEELVMDLSRWVGIFLMVASLALPFQRP